MKLKYIKKFEGYTPEEIVPTEDAMNEIPEEVVESELPEEQADCASLSTDNMQAMSKEEVIEQLQAALYELNAAGELDTLTADKLRQYIVDKGPETILIYNAEDKQYSDRYVSLIIDMPEKLMKGDVVKKEQRVSRFKGFMRDLKSTFSVMEEKHVSTWCDVVLELDRLESEIRNQ